MLTEYTYTQKGYYHILYSILSILIIGIATLLVVLIGSGTAVLFAILLIAFAVYLLYWAG